ncbi:MAG: MGMT family protein [Candidatus Competibacteraceae bacterium]
MSAEPARSYSAAGNQQRIRALVCAIPAGRVATYGQIAALAGLPRRARLVGHALRHLPVRTTVPWHRVINASGTVSFPKGSESYRLQQALLLAEGVEFTGEQIDLNRFRWRPDLDEMLWRF